MDQKKSLNVWLICIVLCLMGFNLVGIATVDNNGVCYQDWTWYFTDHIGESLKAPAGYTDVVMDLYLKNDAANSISMNSTYWQLTIDGVQNYKNTANFDPSIYTSFQDVNKGGEFKTKLVYLVKGNPTTGSLSYTLISFVTF